MRWSIITYGCYTYESTYFWLFMCCITCDASGRVNKSYINANVKGSISAADRKRNHQGFFYSSIINEGWRLIYRLITRLHREWCRDTMMEAVNKKERVESLVSYRNHKLSCSQGNVFSLQWKENISFALGNEKQKLKSDVGFSFSCKTSKCQIYYLLLFGLQSRHKK